MDIPAGAKIMLGSFLNIPAGVKNGSPSTLANIYSVVGLSSLLTNRVNDRLANNLPNVGLERDRLTARAKNWEMMRGGE